MPASREPQYAVVVATCNRGAKITPLVESILRSDVANFEMVIVDQSKDDGTLRAVQPFLADPRIRYFHMSVAGTSRARNQGFALTSAPIIAITDDDCVVPSDWLARMAKPFEIHAEVGVVYCNVDAVPVQRPGHTPNIHFTVNRTIPGMSGLRAGQRLWMGAGMAVRRLMLVDVPGFDETLGPGGKFPACEDNDIAWRGLVHGWWTYENADVAVLHDGFRSLEQLRGHVIRDFYGIGGTMAKYLKTGHFRVAAMLLPLLYRFGVVEPAQSILHRRAPLGLRRPYMLLRGLVDGLRTPLDRTTLCYRKNAVNAR
jgi:glycosyltransferase involved in cell wall biosynthesis